MELEEVIEIAKAEVGYLEKKSAVSLDSKTANAGNGNFTKYWRDMTPGMNGQAWCQCFVNWCFAKAYGETEAKRLLCCSSKGWSYYTPTAAGYFKTAKQWHATDPQAGDIIYFKNSQRIHHVGIVERVSGGKVYTIEGNTSNGTAVITNGGGVCKKSYAIGNGSIAGYGRPAYTSETSSQAKTAAATTAALASAKCFDKTLAGVYTTTAKLNVRADAGTGAAVIGTLAEGAKVQCYGYYNTANSTKWYLIKSGSLTGYCSSKYLRV